MRLKGFAIASMIAALAIALAAAESGARPAEGKLALGKTSQGRGIGARVYERALQILRFNVLLDCRDGSELTVEESGFLATRTRHGGHFRDVQHGRTDTVWLRGRVGRAWVRGRLRVTDRWGRVRCNSGWVRFSARLRR